ncbi:MAG TPA: FkbM family methyltransferase [Acidimicrobiales bacterium]|nr:FkbM family methyltransferase [Acidimicrobiales bacterium]
MTRLAERLRDPHLGRMVICALLPPQVPLRRQLSNGLVFVGPNRRGWGGRGIFVYGEALEPELGIIDSLLSPGDVVFDIGANSGVYTLLAARRVGPEGMVVSLEPNPQMLEVLDRNVRRNRLGNVRLRGLAASDSCAPLAFYEHHRKPNSFSLVPERSSGAPSFTVLTVDLDRLVEWEGLTRVDFIKMDVEGAEGRVLAGARRVIEDFRPPILAEVFLGGLSEVPAGYGVFGPPRKSPNQLLLPDGHRLVEVVTRLGWRPTTLGGSGPATETRPDR